MENYIHYNIKKDLISSIGTSDTFKEQIKQQKIQLKKVKI